MTVASSSPHRRLFLISDRPRYEPSGAGDYKRTISFNSLGGDTSLDVMVGACPQWHAWNGSDLFLRVPADVQIDSIDLRH